MAVKKQIKHFNDFADLLLDYEDDTDKLIEICQAEADAMKIDIPNLNSRNGAFTHRRKFIINYLDVTAEVKTQLLEIVKLSKDELKDRNKVVDDKIKDRANQKIAINSDECITLASKLLKSSNYREVAAGLELLTGRRITELLKTAVFEQKGSHSVLFTGQLKTKDREGGDQPYIIPTLCPAKDAIEGLSRLRQMIDCTALTEDETQRRYGGEVNKAVKQHFLSLMGDKEEAAHSHSLRAIYGVICFRLYRDSDVNELSVYLSEVLGHGDGSEKSALSYKRFYIKNKS